MAYRASRNIEASLIDYITAELTTGGWTNITCQKSYSKVYESQENIGGNNNKAIICIHVASSSIERFEIGDNAICPKRTVIIDIYAANDGQRLDLKDFLIDILMEGCSYYNYTISTSNRNATASKVESGRIMTLHISDVPVDFDTDKSNLDAHDRFRHRLTLTVQKSTVE